MYKILSGSDEMSEVFEESTIIQFINAVSKEIYGFLEKEKNPKPNFYGTMALGKVPLIDGKEINVWLEYDARLIKMGNSFALDAGFKKVIIFDEIPDIVLDRYNFAKKITFENKK